MSEALKRIDTHATAERLLTLRLERVWSVTNLSDRAGVPDAVVRRAEKGSFSIVNLQRLVKAFGVSVDAVLVWREEGKV